MQGKKVIVAGGGTAGLMAAWSLKKRGIEPLVFESSNRAGGRLGGDRVAGFCIDEGADFLTPFCDVGIGLCEELGLPLTVSRVNTDWYRDGRWYRTVPAAASVINFVPAVKMGLLSFGAIKLMITLAAQGKYLNFASNSRLVELDGEENAMDYMRRKRLPEDLQLTIQSFMEKATMGLLDDVGAAYALSYLYGALARADKLQAPKQGMGAIAHALADRLGSEVIRVSTPVRKILIKNGVATGVALDGETVEADAVICATMPSQALELIPELPDEARQVLGSVTYSRGCRVVLGLHRPPFAPGRNGALYPAEMRVPLVMDRSINLPDCAPPGKSTLDLLVNQRWAEELYPLDDDEVRRTLLREVHRNPPPGSDIPGEDEEVIFTRVYRWRQAVCLCPPGMLKAVARMREQGWGIRNLFLAGDYMRVPCVNGALTSGRDAAEEVVKYLGPPGPSMSL